MKSKNKLNRLFLMMTGIFSILLFIISLIACYYAYYEKKAQFLTSMDMVYSRLEQEYENILNNFWQVYMPIFENTSSVYEDFQNYFTNTATDLSPLEKRCLTEALEQLTVRDNRIEWVALYSDNRDINYIKYSNINTVNVLPASFPYIADMDAKSSQMEVYGAHDIATSYGDIMTFAICGGIPSGMGNGKILIGYRFNTFESAISTQFASVPSAHYYMLTNNQILFDSSGSYTTDALYIPNIPQEGLIKYNDQTLYIKSGYAGKNTSMIAYTADWKEIFRASHQDTYWILAITLSFMLLSFIVHISMNRSVSKEVAIIQEGLNRIADNNLDFRLPTDFKQGGLPEIAHNINEMSSKLNENIKKAYYFELKQKDAQLAQLQATFNPHFLYNTLEMLRSKSYANGDDDTSELISDLASIFRNFIGAKTFITLKEELAFTKKYLTLLSARYGDRVAVYYDIDTSLLNYGIIRNVYQILIENYFVHGFDAKGNDNFIRITGKISGENDMLLTMEDNGFGLSEEEIDILNRKIEEPVRHGENSYGLKNLNQRLKLFYGPDYGVRVKNNEHAGLTVQIKIRKMNLSDYNELKFDMENIAQEKIYNI